MAGSENLGKAKVVVTCVYDKDGDGNVDMLDVAELFIGAQISAAMVRPNRKRAI